MKRTNRISSIVWAIGVIGIAVTLFFAWTGMHSHHPARQVEEPKLSVVATETPVPTAAAPEDGLTALVPVPLAPILVPAENGSWTNDKDYLLVPHEPREFGGIEFLMDGMLQLQSYHSKEYRKRTYRTEISVPLPVTSTVGCVHLLGGTRYGEQPQVCAQLVWHYNDRATARTPIANLTHFRDWVRNPYEQPAHLPYAFSKVVWTAAPQPNRILRLYRVSLANPQPQKPVQSIEFVSEMQDPTLFLVGITLDPLKPGERPDNTADLEPMDPLPARTIQIVVTDSAGLPLPNSHLRIGCILQDGAKTSGISRSTSSLTTDANGVANVGYPPQDLNTLDIGASHENYAGRKMLWNLKSGDVVPASYTLKLPAEITIGATVVDVDNNPIPGATVSLYRFWSGGDDDPEKAGEQSDFRTQKQTTGPDGHWRARGLSAEIDHIGFEVSHADYLGTNYTVGENAVLEKQLRAETLRIPLFVGIGAHGLVTDENDNPIADATVWAGRKYTRERQQTKTDSQGRFNFQHVTEGEVSFSVIAKGHEPASQNVTVQGGMSEILFKLKPGHVIRGIVQDDSGLAIPGVQVSLEDAFGGYDAYEFSAATDDEGKFSWDGAPGESVKFYVGKQGYEQKRNVSLKPDEDNVITLHAPRRLEGLVLDSNTGQPIPQFSTRTGRRSPTSSQVYGVIRNQEFKSLDGRFSIQLDEADDDAVQVWGDDYSDKTESFPKSENGVIQLTIRLDPSPMLKGTVTTAEGAPVPGASVVAVTGEPNGSIQFQGNRFRSFDQRNQVATTDDQGAFSLRSVPNRGSVVAIADAGFASTSIDQVRATHVVTLQAFGRIEGTLKIAGMPAAGQELLYNPSAIGLTTAFNTYKTTTDEQGNFAMERIPPGDGSIARLLKTSPNAWMHSHNTPVTVQAGQTTKVTLGDTGAVLRGSIRFQTPPTNSAKLLISGNVSSAGPRMPTFNTPAERQTYIRSPEWQAQMKQMKNYSFVVNADGTFQVDSVAPGSYTINVSARTDDERSFMIPPVAHGSIQFAVPDGADPMNPLFVGEIVLMAIPSQQSAIPALH